MDDSIVNYSCQWFGATNIMTMGRSQMAKQVTNPPRKKKWSAKRKRKINCKRPKGFSERAHCAAKKRRSGKG